MSMSQVARFLVKCSPAATASSGEAVSAVESSVYLSGKICSTLKRRVSDGSKEVLQKTARRGPLRRKAGQ